MNAFLLTSISRAFVLPTPILGIVADGTDELTKLRIPTLQSPNRGDGLRQSLRIYGRHQQQPRKVPQQRGAHLRSTKVVLEVVQVQNRIRENHHGGETRGKSRRRKERDGDREGERGGGREGVDKRAEK